MSNKTKQIVDSIDIPADIHQRVVEDFGHERADEVYRYLLGRVPDGLGNGTRPRHLRCILYLAKGDRKLLDKFIDMCLLDARDVMLWAEAEPGKGSQPVPVRDFEKPFGKEEIASRKTGKA
jgi:hypothetical protein